VSKLSKKKERRNIKKPWKGKSTCGSGSDALSAEKSPEEEFGGKEEKKGARGKITGKKRPTSALENERSIGPKGGERAPSGKWRKRKIGGECLWRGRRDKSIRRLVGKAICSAGKKIVAAEET